jgi:hypothetical protein
MRKHISHGEVNFFNQAKIPKDAKLINPTNNQYKVADSETTGNFHMVKDKEGVSMYEKGGVLYMKNDVPTEVFCVVEERHDQITLDPGIWEIEPAQEFDYLTMEKRNVAD